MTTTRGKSVLDRIAIGPLQVLRREKCDVPPADRRTPAQEWTRFEKAREGARGQLTALYDRAVEEAGEHSAFILVMHREILYDTSFEDIVRDAIENRKATAEEAVETAGARFAAELEAVEDPYVRERAEDVRAVSERLIRALQGRGDLTLKRPAPSIVVADSLTPGETLQMGRSQLLGFVTRRGSLLSHTAILARTLEIPALMGLEIDESWDGRMAVLDGGSGCLHIDPSPEFLARMKQRQKQEQAVSRMLLEWKRTPSVTLDGHKVPVFADLSGPEDVPQVLKCGAEGIGILRSESVFPPGRELPPEEELYRRYRRVVQAMDGKLVVIGVADLRLPRLRVLGMPETGRQPDRREAFRIQLRAMLRCCAWGHVSVMLPGLTRPEEVMAARAVLQECQEELTDRGVETAALAVGVLIDSPAAVMMARELAREADYFCIESGALARSALPVDGESGTDGRHPAVLRMIRRTVQEAHRQGIPVALLGELAADREATGFLLRTGLDSLSVAPGEVIPLRRRIQAAQYCVDEAGEPAGAFG